MSYTNYNFDYRRNKITEPCQLLAENDIFHPTATQKFMLGCILELNDGRMFRYAKDSGTGSAKAMMQCSEPIDAQQLGTLQTAYGVAAGESVFDILCTTANGITDGELVDGYLWVNATGSAEGDMYIVKSNYWKTGDTVMTVEIADAGGIRTAIAATDDISFVKNICRDTKINPTTQDAPVVGVAVATVPAGYYYWAQYRGVAPLTIDASDTVVIGEPIGKAGTAGTAGAGGLVADDVTDCTWGTVVAVSTGGEVGLVNLLLP